ncbi:unnamed protein product [Pedinophyceae sp. YPF-701]|nr:unnamed protein product [Pedinophyceae sp. YPF-701]
MPVGPQLPEPQPPFIVFTDVDGTIAHKEEDLLQHGRFELPKVPPDGLLLPRQVDFVERATGVRHPCVRCLPSARGSNAVISVATLERFAKLRAAGIKIVVVTGGRLATLASRLPALPVADAYIGESGGRIFYPRKDGLTAAPLVEDMNWRQSMAEASKPDIDERVPPHEREGYVWDVYRDIAKAGLFADTMYATTFRVKAPPEDDNNLLERWREEILTDSSKPYHGKVNVYFNLGMMDVVPPQSGKHRSAAYVLREFGGHWSRTAMLCDDENDMELARMVAKAYVPGFTHPAVEQEVREHPRHFVVASEIAGKEVVATMATDVIMERLCKDLGLD